MARRKQQGDRKRQRHHDASQARAALPLTAAMKIATTGRQTDSTAPGFSTHTTFPNLLRTTR